MKRFLFGALIILCAALSSCTQNARVKNFGGDAVIQVPVGMKVVNAGWSNSSLYYLVEPTEENYVPKTKTLYSRSNFGIGSIVFIESK